MMSRVFAPAAGALALATAGLIACSDAQSAPAAPPAQIVSAPLQSSPRFLADDLPMLPAGVVSGARPVGVLRATYEFAARHPEVMKYVPCFCGCERGGHKDNHDCFVAKRSPEGKVTEWDTHGIGCEVCIDVAYQSLQMTNSGASVAAIRDAIEKKYADFQGGHTPTPMPPKRGGT
jgi:hypothetical protein